MQTEAIKALWQVVKAGEARPLMAADLRLLLRVRLALMEYEAAKRAGKPGPERRCRICGVPQSQCCC
jgi:hypothetical protein